MTAPCFWSAFHRSDPDLTLPNIGFPLSFGVFQNYYSQLPEFAGNGYVSVVGTVASGLGYLGAPLATYFIKRYPNHRRHMIMAGCAFPTQTLVTAR